MIETLESVSTENIAIVDDDESVRRAMARLIRAYSSFGVQTYASGREFLDSLKIGVPNCLIVDLRMSDMTGLELLHRLAGIGLRIPTIVATADDEPGMRHRCKLAGAVAFLAKPVTDIPLLDAIKTAMSAPERGDAGANNEKIPTSTAYSELDTARRPIMPDTEQLPLPERMKRYREHALDSRRQAQAADKPESETFFLRIADQWEQLADEIEQREKPRKTWSSD